MGRFMEAMVVCKKGVKAHPDRADPRVLLARVYAEQGKDKKALEEVLGALQVQPADKHALRMAGALQLKTGEAEAGKANLLKAWEVDRADPETLALLQQYKVETSGAAAAPAAPAPVSAAPAPVSEAAPAPVAEPAPAPVQPASKPKKKAEEEKSEQAPRQEPRAEPPASRPAVRRAVIAQDDEDEDEEESRPRKAKKGLPDRSKFISLGLMVALPLILVVYAGYGRWSTQRNREIKKHLDAASEQLKQDSFESYKKACEAADKALEVDSGSVVAHGYLAYAYAIRWGEHGEGDEARGKAEKHLAEAKGEGEFSSHLYAAEALIKTYGGKGKEALTELEERVKTLDAESKQSPLLYLALGLIQMNAGDLERARDSLERAQVMAPDDPRTYAALGTLYRRRGQDAAAWKNFDFALRYGKDHPESLLGKALLMLEQETPNYELAARMIKKLLDLNPPPSKRQLAAAHLARSLLISRVSAAMATLKPDLQAKLAEVTGVPVEKEKAQAELLKAEQTGFGLDKQNPDLLLIKSHRLLAEGQSDAAAAELRRAIGMDSSRAQFYVELSKALMGKPGGEKEATEALATALKTMGDSPKLLVMLGNAYRRQGKLDEALTQYTRAVQDPKAKNPEARMSMGAIYRERKDWAKAQEALEKASQEFVGQADRMAMSLTELARVYEAKGDADKADEAFQRALNADESYAPAYYFYASFTSKVRKQGSKARLLAQEYLKREPKGEYASDAQRL